MAQKLSYTLIHRSLGRIYALDMGKEHRNPLRSKVGRIHKHHWKELLGDKEAYIPEDITAPLTDPVAVWKQFCTEARITQGLYNSLCKWSRPEPVTMGRQGARYDHSTRTDR